MRLLPDAIGLLRNVIGRVLLQGVELWQAVVISVGNLQVPPADLLTASQLTPCLWDLHAGLVDTMDSRF